LKNDEIKEKGGTKKPTNKLIKSQKQTKKDKITTTKKRDKKRQQKQHNRRDVGAVGRRFIQDNNHPLLFSIANVSV